MSDWRCFGLMMTGAVVFAAWFSGLFMATGWLLGRYGLSAAAPAALLWFAGPALLLSGRSKSL